VEVLVLGYSVGLSAGAGVESIVGFDVRKGAGANGALGAGFGNGLRLGADV
jgi:hypothetical protein